jgi:hypothetical protein
LIVLKYKIILYTIIYFIFWKVEFLEISLMRSRILNGCNKFSVSHDLYYCVCLECGEFEQAFINRIPAPLSLFQFYISLRQVSMIAYWFEIHSSWEGKIEKKKCVSCYVFFCHLSILKPSILCRSMVPFLYKVMIIFGEKNI